LILAAIAAEEEEEDDDDVCAYDFTMSIASPIVS
jgi:hypothetical protein